MISANDIRSRFLEYFEKNGHTIVDSSALTPRDDPSLLFTNAGMVQFKKIFLGQEQRGYCRAVTSQKCLRVGGKHNDLENVGRTARHHTFFEMLGNFSFGDYFKEDAIRFAWEFLTEDLKLPKDKLYATVFTDDDEAEELWKKVAGLPPERIRRLDEKDNFWSMGDTGPCGPCSEILIDQGEHMTCGPDCGIGVCDCDRYLEIWNLVFMQYNQDETGERTPLPRPSIDTGMGLERISAVCQGVYSNFDIDLFQQIIGFTAAKAGVEFKKDEETDTALRVIADHSRAMAFMIADGILPSNEGRGYVLRRLIRRAFRFGRLISLNEPFLHETASKVVDLMGEGYPELLDNREFMARVIREEEERFSQTLDKGLAMLEEELESLRSAGKKTVPGETAFKLYDTFGFPIDIVNDVAEKAGFAVDEEGYKQHMGEQRERAKAAWKGSGEVDLASRFQILLEEGLTSRFVGYDSMAAGGRIVALLDESALPVEKLAKGEKGYLVASTTPYYGESGGQVGDTGQVATPSGRAEVTDTLKPAAELTVHQVTVPEGELLLDQEADLVVDEGVRTATARNHTATHLLHAALRKVLGDHVKQAGSLVGPDRLRFDFTHISAMTPEEIQSVEKEVNKAIMADAPIRTEVTPYDKAVEQGAIALFGEKYTSDVRVVEAENISVELCGGTHLSATGQAGLFLILSEAGVSAGVRRIEAATGWNALTLVQEQRAELAAVAGEVKARPGDIASKVKGLKSDIKKLNKELQKAATAGGSASGKSVMDELNEVNGVKFLAASVVAPNVKGLRDMMDDVRSKLPSGVACLAAEVNDKLSVLIYVSKDLHGRFTAPQLFKEISPIIDGSGGGRPDLAQGGGANPARMGDAFAVLRQKLEE